MAREDSEKLPSVKWMAAAKLLTTKEFSEASLISTMRAAWNPAREVSFRAIGKNLFVVQAFCLGHLKRIMEEGPWIFRGCALMLEEYDGGDSYTSGASSSSASMGALHKVLPLYRTESILNQLAGKIRELVSVEMRAIPTDNGEFHRARVNLEAARPLQRFVSLKPEGRESILIQIKYEKLPRFCSHCGLMGHTHLECGTGEFLEEDLQFGEWMLAVETTWRPGTPRFRGNVGGERGQPRVEHPTRVTGARGGSRAGRGF